MHTSRLKTLYSAMKGETTVNKLKQCDLSAFTLHAIKVSTCNNAFILS